MFNKKGTTLVEVIISTALISIVLAFMIKLLVDINNTETNNKYAKGNQIKRAEIIRTIEDDIRNKIIKSVDDNSSNSELKFTINFADSTSSTITCTKNVVKYLASDSKTEKWTLDEGTVYIDKANVYLRNNSELGENSIYTLLIDIEIHTSNENNTILKNNTIDDILINYIGYEPINISNCLGNSC